MESLQRILVACATIILISMPPAAAQSSEDELDFLFGEGQQSTAPQRSQEERTETREAQPPEGANDERSDRSVEEEPVIALPDRDDGTTATRARPTSRLIEEIVVTAQKREEDLQDVPLSVQAFSADFLDVRGITSVQNLPQITPGLTITTQVAYTSPYIRGVGSDAFLLADPSVASYYDGIYFPFPNGLVQDFGEIERIEVLKGPQGTLFGRNAVGGAIHTITREPALEDFSAAAGTSYARHNASKSRAFINIPLGSSFAVNLSGVYDRSDYHVRRVSAGEELPAIDAIGGRLRARWAPADWLNFDITGIAINNNGPTTSFTPNTDPSAIFGATIQPQDPYDGEVNEDIFFRHENRTIYGKAELFLRPFDVRLLGSDQDIFSSFNYDFDGSPQPLSLFNIDRVFGDIQTGELQILSNDRTWFSNRLQWIVGAYYFRSTQGFDPSSLRVASTDLSEGQLLGMQLPPETVELVNNALGPFPVPSGEIEFIGLIGTESISGFAQATLSITDWLALTLGGRYQSEKRTLIESSSALRNFDGTTAEIQSFRASEDEDLEDTTRSFDPKVSVELRPSWGWLGDAPLLYATYQTAVKSSTYNTVNIYNAPDFVEAEDITAYEIGLKTTLFNGLASFNTALFRYTIDNQQVQFISLLAGGAVRFENAGSVRVLGAEVDSFIQIAPRLTNGMVLNLGAAFLDPVYTSFPDGSGFDENTGLLTQGNDFTGNQVVRSPEFTGNLGVTQPFDTRWGPLELGVDYYYNSGFFYSAQNSPRAAEGAYQLLNARISFLVERWNLRLTAFGDNILDERYNLSRFISDFGIADAAAPRVTYGLRLNIEF